MKEKQNKKFVQENLGDMLTTDMKQDKTFKKKFKSIIIPTTITLVTLGITIGLIFILRVAI